MVTILVVDDDPEGRKFLSILLEREGFRVITAANGIEAMSKALVESPALVILDVMMPEVDGYQVCRQFRDTPRLAGIPILILTARAQPIDREISLKAGADAYLAKPFQHVDLLREVRALLSTRQIVPSRALMGRIVSVVSLRGGVGVTSIAVNLAIVLSLKYHEKVLLVDLNLSAGQAALMLNLKAPDFWRSLLGRDGVDWALVDRYLVRHTSGVSLIAAPAIPLGHDRVPAGVIDSLLSLVQDRFDRVIVDIPPSVDGPIVQVMLSSHRIVLVLAPEVASLRSACALRALLQNEGCQPERFTLVLNHNNPLDVLPKETVEKIVGCPLAVEIPHEPQGVTEAIVKGYPVVLDRPASAWSRAVAALADVVEEAIQANDKKHTVRAM